MLPTDFFLGLLVISKKKKKKKPPKAVTMADNEFCNQSINQIKSLDIITSILHFYHYCIGIVCIF